MSFKLKVPSSVFLLTLVGMVLWATVPVLGDDDVAVPNASVGDDNPDIGRSATLRHEKHSPRPDIPRPQRPAMSTKENVDADRSILDWQHLTDDWFGLRPKLDDRGIIFEGSITSDLSSNFHGGANTEGSAFRYLLDVNLTVDTQRLIGWEGGTFFFDFQNQAGESGTTDVGDLQGISNIDSAPFSQTSELWYQQMLFDGVLRVKLGKVDANSEFAFVDNGGEFINSSMGVSPTIFVIPTYPDPATSINIFVYPTEWLYAGFGLYDGATNDGGFGRTGNRGPKTFFGDPADMFLIGEVGATWALAEQTLPGRLGVGGWGHTGTFTQFNGATQSGTEGFYLVFDQTVWREHPADEDDEQAVGVFFQYGQADEAVSAVSHHLGAGAVWTGAIPTRDADVLGLGVTWVDVSNRAGAGFTEDGELTVETFYKIELIPSIHVKPDLQYIVNPGGLSVRDAIVGTLRMEIAF